MGFNIGLRIYEDVDVFKAWKKNFFSRQGLIESDVFDGIGWKLKNKVEFKNLKEETKELIKAKNRAIDNFRRAMKRKYGYTHYYIGGEITEGLHEIYIGEYI